VRVTLLAMLSACSFDPQRAIDDAPPVDVGVDASIDAPFTMQIPIETLAIPASGEVIQFTSVLEAGRPYLLRASGTFVIVSSSQLRADAEYFRFSDPIEKNQTVDVGLAVDDEVVDLERQPFWGAYNPEHVYEVEWLGEGRPIRAMIHDSNYTNNSGELELTILELR
jgi:hypothetical protein